MKLDDIEIAVESSHSPSEFSSSLSVSGHTFGSGQPHESDIGATAQSLWARGVRSEQRPQKRMKMENIKDHSIGPRKLLRFSNRVKQEYIVDPKKNGVDESVVEHTLKVFEAAFEAILSQEFKRTEEFERNIFELVRTLFQDNPAGIPDEYIVVWMSDDKKSALALGRQISKKKLGFDEKLGTSSERSRNDHASVVLKLQGNEWKCHACTSLVEFKMLDTMRSINIRKKTDGRIYTPGLTKKNGPIAQVVSYSISQVWPSIRKIQWPGVIERLSLTIIAGTRTGTGNKKVTDLRYISGSLEIPKSCGDVFKYIFNNVGYVSEDEKACRDAMATYFSTLSEGIHPAFAKDWNEPQPLSGLSPDYAKDLGITDLACFMTAISTNNFRQGDFWRGTHDGQKVMVKICSNTIHGSLVPSIDNGSALTAINGLLNNCKSALMKYKGMKAGFAIVMKDLNETHEDVEMKKHKGNEGKYWTAFEKLVTSLLRPAAQRHGVCFVDLRMGYDLLSNVMVTKVKNDSDPVHFDLIDFNSFKLGSLQNDELDGRYPYPYDQAETYVYVQVVLLGLHWVLEVDQADAKATDYCDLLENHCRIGESTKVDDDDFKEAFEIFREIFSKNEEFNDVHEVLKKFKKYENEPKFNSNESLAS